MSTVKGRAAVQDDVDFHIGAIWVAKRQWKSHQAYDRDLTDGPLASSAKGKGRRSQLSRAKMRGSWARQHKGLRPSTDTLLCWLFTVIVFHAECIPRMSLTYTIMQCNISQEQDTVQILQLLAIHSPGLPTCLPTWAGGVGAAKAQRHGD